MDYIDNQRLAALFSEEGIPLNLSQLEAFERYAGALVEWNEKINLTAITDQKGIEEKHFLDCALPLKLFEIPQNASVIDVGTGAGFPGIPFKIIRPDIKLTLLDSLQKRIAFLNEVLQDLSIDALTLHGRAEDCGKAPEMREQFDIATARAVARLSVLTEYCLPFVRVGGYFLALKGGDCAEEIGQSLNAIAVLGGRLLNSYEYNLPSGDRRTLIVIEKIKPTLPAYPRPQGRINKKPL